MKLRVMIADDELLARKRLTRLLHAMVDVELVMAVDGAEALVAALARERVDVVLLDIRMPGLDGIDAAALLPEPRPQIVFVTAHRDHAVDAFDRGAVDYVLKPVDPARLRQALERARRRKANPDTARLALPTHDGVVLVDPRQVTHLSFDGELVTVHRASDPPVITDHSLRDLEARLPPGFERVHRRHVINLSLLERLRQSDAGCIAILPGAEVPVSRQAARRLRALLEIA